MSSTGQWQNADGLMVKFHGEYERASLPHVNRARGVVTAGVYKQLIMDIDLQTVGASATYFPFDLDNDGTNDGFTDEEAYLPAGSAITRAHFVCTEVSVGGTDFTVGTYSKAGATIDADGILDATNGAEANSDAVGEIVICSGALVGDATGTLGVATNDSYIAVTTNGTFTAGKGKLVIEYFDPNGI